MKTNNLIEFPEGISASAILYSLPNAVFFTDTQMRIIYFNAEAERITEFRAHEACGMYCKDVMKSEICETECIVKKALNERQNIFETEISIKNANGNIIPVIASASLITNNEGKIAGYLYSFRDIISLKQIENALRDSESKLEAMLHSISDHMSMMDRELNIIWANEIAKGIFGNDIIGKKCYEAYHGRNKPCEPFPCLTLRAFSDGKIHEHETSVIDKNGNTHYFHCTANVALCDKNGEPLTVLEISRDITEKKKLEERLIHSQKMDAIGQLAGGIAHDFNNLLTAIIGYSNLLQIEIGKNPEIEQILMASQRAASLTQALLAFSRKQIISPRPVNLNEVVVDSQKLLSRLIGENIEISVELINRDLIIMADATQLDQILINLATNARDAMPSGGKILIQTNILNIDELYVAAHGYGEPGEYAELSFQDTGSGMDIRTREKIFEPFFTTKELGKGTGLGLATVYGIVKQHKGYINVYSELGKGTLFKIYFPLSKSKPIEDEKKKQINIPTGNETILVAEDDIQVRSFIKSTLEKFGYTVLLASDGEDALKVFYENNDKINLLITDMLMPKKDGKEVYEEIKQVRPELNVIFISGYIDNILKKKGMLEDGVRIIQKPILPQELLVQVREMLDNV